MSAKLRPRFTIAVASLALLAGLISLEANTQKIQKLSRKEVRALIASATTPSEHEKLAAYYRDEAESLTAEQREHEKEFKEYAENSSRYPSKCPTMGDHCRELAGAYKMAAEKALVMADMHTQMARAVRASEPMPK